jgi:hypothetical protein
MSGRVIVALRVALLALAATTVIAGCAGPTKLAEKSQQKLSSGDIWRAWQLATRALDREPMNPKAKDAAAAAGRVIADDWQRKITALAPIDSVQAAEQVLEFTQFRTNAINYTTIEVTPAWAATERTLRMAAARDRYLLATQAKQAHRPKAAFAHFHDVERFVPNYKDAPQQAERAYQAALTQVAVLPFSSGSDPSFGRDVSDHWRDALAKELAPPAAQFTRIMGGDAITGRMTVSQLGRLTREDAIKLGRKSGAERIVWGSLGNVKSETQLQFFRDVVAHKVVQKDDAGHDVVRWVDVPIEVVARVRDVSVDVDYEVIATEDGTSLSHEHAPRSSRARVVWTSFVPDGDVGSYSLVSETVRSQNPDRAKDVETRWKNVCGETTTLAQVLSARRETRGDQGYDRGTIGRFVTGAAFVFMQELPPAQDLALAAVSGGWQPLRKELSRLDGMDDVDLGVALGDDQ